jgi:hypothetical protein
VRNLIFPFEILIRLIWIALIEIFWSSAMDQSMASLGTDKNDFSILAAGAAFSGWEFDRCAGI